MKQDSASRPIGKREEPAAVRKSWLRRLPAMLGRILIYGLIVLLMLWWLERKLIFFPEKYPHGYWATDGLPFEEVHFQAGDGTRLHGWFLRPKDPRGYVLFAHGNGGNITHWKEPVAKIAQSGAAVMIFDYRGYGKSEGTPAEPGILDDARSARRWLAEKEKIPEREIILWGTSIGGGVMVDLAAKDGARALVLDRAFSSLPDVAKVHYPWFPSRLLMRNRLESLDKIGRYAGPLLQSHGDVDEIVPVALGERLFAAARGKKEFLLMPGVLHNDPLPPEFWRAWERFLRELP